MKNPSRRPFSLSAKSVARLLGTTGRVSVWATIRGSQRLLASRLGWMMVLLALLVGCGVFGWAGYAAAQTHSGGAGTVEGLNPLESWKADLALWTAVVFLLLLVILWKYAWGPIARALQQREQTIADQIAQAQRQHQEAQALLAQYQQKLAQSQQEIQQMLDQARRQAEQTSRDIIQQAHQQAEADRQKMLQDIQQAKQQALREIATETANLAVLLAGKILQAELRPERHRQLIQQVLAEWEAACAGNGDSPSAKEEPRG